MAADDGTYCCSRDGTTDGERIAQVESRRGKDPLRLVLLVDTAVFLSVVNFPASFRDTGGMGTYYARAQDARLTLTMQRACVKAKKKVLESCTPSREAKSSARRTPTTIESAKGPRSLRGESRRQDLPACARERACDSIGGVECARTDKAAPRLFWRRGHAIASGAPGGERSGQRPGDAGVAAPQSLWEKRTHRCHRKYMIYLLVLARGAGLDKNERGSKESQSLDPKNDAKEIILHAASWARPSSGSLRLSRNRPPPRFDCAWTTATSSAFCLYPPRSPAGPALWRSKRSVRRRFSCAYLESDLVLPRS